MPTTKSSPAAKRQPLTLAQLSAYDDILTDALVDHVYYWTTIPKNRPLYHASRGVREEDIAKIIQDEIVINKDVDAAESKLLQTDGLRRYLNGLRTAKEKDDFRKHLRRYIQIYLPDCPWEVSTTNRYTIVTHEASVTARRFIKRNESIKYLSGIQVNITDAEEKAMAMRKKDFSIVVSSRSKCASLFMGPARFANHDCNANAKLMTTGHAGIEIIATRPIEVGEEITVTYGESYFGEDNCECLCCTCEEFLRNGWEPEEGATVVKPSIEEESKTESYALRRRRREESVGGSSRTSSVTPVMRPRVSKIQRKASNLGDRRNSAVVDSPKPDATPRGRKRPIDVLATPPITPAKKFKHLLEPPSKARAMSRGSSVTASISSSSTRDAVETDVTSPEKESPEPVLQTPSKEPTSRAEEQSKDSITVLGYPSDYLTASSVSGESRSPSAEQTESRPVDLSAMSIASILDAPVSNVTPPPSQEAAEADAESRAETVHATIEKEDVQEQPKDIVQPVKRKYQRRTFEKQPSPAVRARVPGDYVLTHLLLSEPNTAWIQCGNCDTYFVQQNAYYTRSSCPRCERHSKLYGYIWPKTDKEGPRDKEERILDHRTIHRFLDPDDERKVRGRKSLNELTTQSESPESDAEEVRGRSRAKKGQAAKDLRALARVRDEDEDGLRRSRRARRVSSRLAES